MRPEQERVHVNDIDINVVQSGEGTPALLFLHYWGGSSRTWAAVTERLSADCRCIAIDFRGWGSSGKSSDDYSLETLADDIAALIAARRLSDFIIIGHSMGGKVAQLLCGRNGGRDLPGLKGLVLIAPAPPQPLPVPAEQRKAMIASYRTREGADAAIGILSALPVSAEWRERIVEDILAGAPEAKRAWPETGMTTDISAEAARISAPVRIVVGSADTIEQESALRRSFAAVLPAAEFFTLPGVGHLSPVEAPAAVADAIRDALQHFMKRG